MYICENCEAVFWDPIVVYERHGLDRPPYEPVQACPECRVAGGFREVEDELETA